GDDVYFVVRPQSGGGLFLRTLFFRLGLRDGGRGKRDHLPLGGLFLRCRRSLRCRAVRRGGGVFPLRRIRGRPAPAAVLRQNILQAEIVLRRRFHAQQQPLGVHQRVVGALPLCVLMVGSLLLIRHRHVSPCLCWEGGGAQPPRRCRRAS